ncbi:response regulator [Neobacillus ginsengisoli]|uniref:Two-component system CitB family response regulator n=1 Tax=Neobacillus ginsengisoli TaxID=904295 RepID=A0ABT9XUN7_9BACI|nr:response regulator [Neobacillus ginsengisoli]MDQ0199285.1 two-component system CitB family response regulator [Neobacillus ginsengisoli]
MAYPKIEDQISVLIIEDDVRIAEINRRLVEKVPGYHVIGIATDEQQAKEQLAILRPHLVLLDIYFPDMNGLAFLQVIRQYFQETDVIMITASREINSVKEALRSGVFDFIVKPLVFERLKNSLENYQEFRSRLRKIQNENQHVNQEEIDKLMEKIGQKEQLTPYLPKGIDKITLHKVTEVLNQSEEGLNAERLAKKIGISRPTARRYLEYLVAKEQISADLSYGDVGRPERIYLKK